MRKSLKVKLLGLTFAGLSALTMTGEAVAGRVAVKTKGGLKVYDTEGKFWFKVNGRLHIDQTFFNGNSADRTGFPSGSNIRRAFVDFKGGFYDDWAYKLQVDFSNGDAQLLETFIAYTGLPNSTVAVGQFTQPQGMENWSSSNAFTFVEPALPTIAFTPGLGIGLYGDWHGEMLTFAGTIVHPADEATATPFGTNANNSDSIAVTGRATIVPIRDDMMMLHFGVSGRYQDLHSTSNGLTFAVYPEALGRSVGGVTTTTSTITTGAIAGSAQDFFTFGFEAAGQYGPFTLQGEYIFTSVDRASLADLDFEGWYVQGTYTITGEMRPYDFPSGTFGRIKPMNTCGAWEVALRYSYVSLEDHEITVGNEHNFTAGVNWYANNNLRFMLNYIYANAPSDRDLDIVALRAQVVW